MTGLGTAARRRLLPLAAGLFSWILALPGPAFSADGQAEPTTLLSEARELLGKGAPDKALELLGRPELEGNAQAFYWTGEALRRMGRYDEAVDVLKEAVRLVPGLVDAHLLLGEIYRRQGRLGAAIGEFEIADRLAVGSPFQASIRDTLLGLYRVRSERLLERLASRPGLASKGVELAKKMFRLGLYSETERLLEAIVERSRDDAQAYYWLGQVYLRRRRQNEGLRSLERSVELAPDNPLLRLQLGKVYEDLGRFDKAEGIYGKVLSSPGLSDALRDEARRHLEVVEARRRAIAGDTEEALARYRRLLEQRPDDPGLLELTGLALEKLGRRGEADGIYARLRRLLPDDATLRLKLAEIYRLRGDLIAMQSALKEALVLARDEDVRRQALDALGLKRGDELILLGDFDKARRLFESLLTLVPGHPEVLMRLARIALDQKRYDEAEGYLEQVLAIDDGRLDARLKLGRVYMETGRTQKAIQAFERVARAGAAHDEARSAVAFLRTLYGRLVESLMGRLSSASTVDAGLRKAAIDLGRRLYGRGQIDEAERVFESLLERVDDDAQAYFWLGQIQLRTRRLEDGIASLERSVGLAPANARLVMELAKAYEEAGRWVKAERAYAAVLELDPPQTMRRSAEKRRRIVQGQKLAQDGDERGALEIYDGLIGDYPDDLQILALKGWLLQKLGRRDEADAVFADLLERGPKNVRIRLRLASLYEEQKRYDKAETVLREVVDLDPKNAAMHYELARILLLSEKFVEAHHEFTLAASLARPASQLLARARASRDAVVKRMIKKGREHLDANEYDAAESLFREVLGIDPDEARAHYWLSQVFKHRKAFSDEVAALERSIALSPDNPLLIPVLGQAYLDAGLPGKAVDLLEPVVEANPFAFESRLLLASAYEKRGDVDLAEAQFAWLLRHETPDDIRRQALDRLGMDAGLDALEKGEIVAARDHFQRLLDVVPLEPEVNRKMAETFLREKDLERALPYLQTAVVSSPDDPELHFHLARLYEDLGRLDEADAEYRLLMSMDVSPRDRRRARAALDRTFAVRVEERLDTLDLETASDEDVAALVEEAERMVEIEATTGAKRLAEALLKTRPEGILGYRLLARVNRQKERYDDAVLLLRRALEIDPGNVRLLEELARTYAAAGRMEQALATYREVLERDPGSVGPLMAMAGIYRDLGDEEAKRRAYAKVLRQGAEAEVREKALAGLGIDEIDEALAQGDFELAGEHLQRLIALLPDDPDVLLRRARLASETGHADEAEAILRRLLDGAKDRLDARLALGELLLARGRPKAAMDELERVARAGPRSPEARRAVKRLQGLYGEQARALRQRLLSHPKGQVPASLRARAIALGRRLVGRGRFADAEGVLRTLMERAEPTPEMFYWLGQVELKTNRRKQGIEHLRRSVALAPDNPRLYRELGKALELVGRWREAEEAYAAVRDKETDAARRREAEKRFVIVRGQRLAQEGRRLEALALYDDLIERHPDDVQILGLRGWLLLGLGREDEADAMFGRLLALAPDNDKVRLRLAELYEKQGRRADAERQLLAILERRPTGSMAVAALQRLGLDRADALRRRKDWKGLEALYEELLEKVPGNPVLLKLQADLYSQQRRLPEFERALRRVLEVAPDDVDSLWGLANLYVRTRREEKAVPLLERLVGRERDSQRGKQALQMLSDIYRRQVGRLRDQKEYAKAAAVLRKFIERNPDNILARMQLGLIYFFGNELDKAAEVLEEVTRLAPDQMPAYSQLAVIYTKQRKHRKAMENLAHFIALQTDEEKVRTAVTELLLSLVRAYLAENRQVAAIRVLERMRDLGFRDKLIYGMLGFVQTRQGQTKQAIETYRQGIAIDGDDLLMRFNLGRLYEQTSADMAALAQYRAILKRGKPGNRYVESARQRKEAIERRLRRFNSSLSYRVTVGRSVIEEQDLSSTGAVNTSFSSSLNYRLSTSFRPSKTSIVTVAAGMAHSLNHSGQNDSIAPSLSVNGNLNLGSGFLNASASYRETHALLLNVFAGYGVNASVGGGFRFAHPIDALAGLFSFGGDPFPDSVVYVEHPRPGVRRPSIGEGGASLQVDEGRIRKSLEERGGDIGPMMARLHRARLALQEGKDAVAIHELTPLAERLPDDPDINLLIGEAYQRIGDTDSAIASYWRVFDVAQDSPRARYLYGEVLHAQGYGDEAADWYAAVVDSAVASSELKAQAGRRLAAIYRHRIEGLMSADDSKDRLDRILVLVDRLVELDDPDEVRRIVGSLLEDYPDEPRLQLHQARAWLRLGRPDKALPGLEAVRRRHGRTMGLSRDLERAYLDLGRLDEALVEIRWRLERVDDPERRFRLRLSLPAIEGDAWAASVDERAADRIRQRLEAQWQTSPASGEGPEDPEALLTAIDEALRAGFADVALDYYRRLLESTPDEALLELRVAETLSLQGLGREAGERVALALGRDARPIVYYRGLALLGFYSAVEALGSGDEEEALEVLESIHDLLPDDPLVLLNLGLAEHRLEQDVRASAWFETVVENDPDDLTAHWLLGVFYSQKNQINRGMNALERVVADGPGTLAAERASALLKELEQKRLRALIGEDVKEQEASTKTFQATLSYNDFTPVNHSIAETKSYGISNSLRLPSARWGSFNLGYGLTKAVNENPLGTDYANTTQSLSLSYNRPVPGIPKLSGGVSLSHQIVDYDHYDTNARVKLGRLAKRRIVRNALSVNLSYQLHGNLTLTAGYSQSRSRSNLPVGLVYRPDDRPIAYQSLGLGDLSSKSLNVGISFRF